MFGGRVLSLCASLTACSWLISVFVLCAADDNTIRMVYSDGYLGFKFSCAGGPTCTRGRLHEFLLKPLRPVMIPLRLMEVVCLGTSLMNALVDIF